MGAKKTSIQGIRTCGITRKEDFGGIAIIKIFGASKAYFRLDDALHHEYWGRIESKKPMDQYEGWPVNLEIKMGAEKFSKSGAIRVIDNEFFMIFEIRDPYFYDYFFLDVPIDIKITHPNTQSIYLEFFGSSNGAALLRECYL